MQPRVSPSEPTDATGSRPEWFVRTTPFQVARRRAAQVGFCSCPRPREVRLCVASRWGSVRLVCHTSLLTTRGCHCRAADAMPGVSDAKPRPSTASGGVKESIRSKLDAITKIHATGMARAGRMLRPDERTRARHAVRACILACAVGWYVALTKVGAPAFATSQAGKHRRRRWPR